MSLEIKKATDIKRGQDFSALIYSAPGVGKTSTAKFLPGKTLVIDIDRTTNVLAGEPNIDVCLFRHHRTILINQSDVKRNSR